MENDLALIEITRVVFSLTQEKNKDSFTIITSPLTARVTTKIHKNLSAKQNL
jgi:hypothetical protein